MGAVLRIHWKTSEVRAKMIAEIDAAARVNLYGKKPLMEAIV